MGETTTTPNQAAGYETYDLLLGSQNMAHPARQGFGEVEYVEAMTDPHTASTEVNVDGEVVKVPQLVPLSHVKWLNADFYAKKFPEAFASEAIYCFNNSLGAELGDEVRAGLKDLAERQGVLVFDYPVSDPEYLAKVTGALSEVGIATGELQELGTQTYYGGKVVLKREHETTPQPLGLAEAFDKMVADGSYEPSRLSHGASLHTTVPAEQTAVLDKSYEDAFQVLNDHPCKQGLSPEEFMKMVAEDEDVIKILYAADGEIESLCLLGDKLEKFDWINPAFYRRAYPKEAANNQIVYFPAIATDPAKQGGRNSEAMIGLLAQLCEAGDNEMAVCFDCCDINKGFLDVFLEAMIKNTPEASIKFSVLDTQRYCALPISLETSAAPR